MCFFLSVLPATLFVTLGYLVLIGSSASEGATKTIGRVLAIWLFILSSLIPVAGGYVTLAGLCDITFQIGDEGE